MLIPDKKPPQTNDETLEIPDRLLRILQSCASDNTAGHRFPPTEIFNEGWMLRLVLDALQTVHVPSHPLRFLDGAQWFSEARLSSPFPSIKRGDRMGESSTCADAVIGDFEFRKGTKAGLTLKSGCRQFIVVEAKMFSNLSSRTTNAKGYNQAARTVACMAETISQSDVRLKDLESVGYFVLTAKEDPKLARCLKAECIRDVIDSRITRYNDLDSSLAPRLSKWKEQHLLPLIEHLEEGKEQRLACYSWEQIIQPISRANNEIGKELNHFFECCRRFGQAKLYHPSPR
jgi:hypothetical protein